MPEKNVDVLKTLQCDVLGIFGIQDSYISPHVVSEFQSNMNKARKKLTVLNYNEPHAFANPSNPKYDKENSAKANAATVQFLRSSFNH